MPITRDSLSPAIIRYGQRVLQESAEWVARDTKASEWVHDEPPAPFDPHIALHGVTFDSPNDDQLENLGTFPAVPFFALRDHKGCKCTHDPVVVRVRIISPSHVRLEAPTRQPKPMTVRGQSGGRKWRLHIPSRRSGQPRWWRESLSTRWPNEVRNAARTVRL